MKNCKCKIFISACIVATSLLLSVNSFSQTKKLPDGTIVYGDGTKKLPNGTVIYKDGTTRERGTTVTLPNGTVKLPEGSERSPKERKHVRRSRSKWLPPGQAKKIYGGSATNYAPGQQKKLKKNKEWKEGENKGKHKIYVRGKRH